MGDCFICELLGKKVPGVKKIDDALELPEKYNGKHLCQAHWNDREYYKQMDVIKYINREVREEDKNIVILYENGRRVGVKSRLDEETE